MNYQADAPELWDFPLRSKVLHPNFCKGVLRDHTTSFPEQMRFNGQLVWETLQLAFNLGDSGTPTGISEKLCNKDAS